MSNICPACESGVLVAFCGEQEINYAGRALLVRGLSFSRCPVCGEELALPEQAKLNDVLFADAKREADDLWTSSRIKEWRMKWSLSQQQAAKLLGGGANAFSKYERGEVIQSSQMNLLMRLFDDVPDARKYIRACAGLDAGTWKTADIFYAPEASFRGVRKLADVSGLYEYFGGAAGVGAAFAASVQMVEAMRAGSSNSDWEDLSESKPVLNYGT